MGSTSSWYTWLRDPIIAVVGMLAGGVSFQHSWLRGMAIADVGTPVGRTGYPIPVSRVTLEGTPGLVRTA